jgi:hypothetical protein
MEAQRLLAFIDEAKYKESATSTSVSAKSARTRVALGSLNSDTEIAVATLH